MTEKKEKLMEQLFRTNYERMYRLAFALLHDNEEARDVVSDVFSKLWDAEIKEETASAYLMRSVKNACIDKWDTLLDLLENPSKYSETQKDEILGDEEMMDMYRQMVEVRQALDSQKKNEEMSLPSIDEEWEKLKEKKLHKAETDAKVKQPAKVVTLWSPMRKVAAVVVVLVVSGFAFAAIHLAVRSYQSSLSPETSQAQVENKDSVQRVAAEVQKADVANDSVSAKLPLLYENMELQDILKPIAQHFNLQVEYKSESSKHIRLYLQLTEQMSLDEIIELMNHFEKVNVHVEGNTLVVE